MVKTRKIVFTDAGVKDVSNTACDVAYSELIDQIECEEQKRNY